jgi:hypothetical protein
MQTNSLSKINSNTIFKHDMSSLGPHIMGADMQISEWRARKNREGDEDSVGE